MGNLEMEDKTMNNEFIEKKGEAVEPPVKGVTEEQNALYLDFKNKDAEWHQAQTKTLLRKVDLHLLPLLVLMYLLNFLDRK